MPYKTRIKRSTKAYAKLKRWIKRGYHFDGCTGVPDFNVRTCCDRHDFDYQSLTKTRAQADANFRSCMLKKAARETTLPAIATGVFVALVYWIGVRVFGGSHWKGKQNETLGKIIHDSYGPVGDGGLRDGEIRQQDQYSAGG